MQDCPWHFYLLQTILRSRHSRKLHIFGLRANTICISSLTIFFLSRSAVAVYHFCSRSLPCRLNSSMKRIYMQKQNSPQKDSTAYMRTCIQCVGTCQYINVNLNYWPSKGTFPVNCILVPNYESLHHSFLLFALFVNIIIKSDIINNFCVQMLFQLPKAKKYRDVIKS